MQSIHGCDSIDSLSLRIHKTYKIYDETINICENETPYKWRGLDNITATGDYKYGEQTVDGYDSIHYVHINVSPILYTTIVDTVCEGVSKLFGLEKSSLPRYLNKTGVYYDTLMSHQYGCDSIIELRLIVIGKQLKHYTVDIADVDTPYIWRHINAAGVKVDSTKLYHAGEYTYRFESSVGCDSIDSLSLRIHQTYHMIDDTINICQNDIPYTWRGLNNITTTGDYRYGTQTTAGYDSIYIVHVNVWPIQHDTIRASICEGDYYPFGGDTLTQAGVYNHTSLKTSHGCDNITTLILSVNRKFYQILDRNIYEGDTITFFGKKYYTTGNFKHEFKSSTGCDSVVELRVVVSKDDSVSICENDLPYRWQLLSDSTKYKEIKTPGSYYDTVYDIEGRVFYNRLKVNIMKVKRSEQSLVFCEGDSVIYRNTTYKANGTFYDTIRMTTGCDSIIKINVTVHPTYEYFDIVNISDKEVPYDFYGRKLTQTGYYENMETDKQTGCNRIHHLNLTVHKTYLFEDSVHLCMPDTLIWHNQIITTAGSYHDSLYTVYGYDSVYHLRVGAHSIASGFEKYELGKGEEIELEDTVIRTTGDFWFTHKTIYGCDSIVHVYVVPKSTREFSWSKEICQGSYFEFFDKKLTRSGIYHWESDDKDSIVNLTLTVKPVPVNEERVVITDKQADGGTYVHNGQLYEGLVVGSNLFADTLIAANGCDSVSRLVIVVTTHYSDWTPIPLCPGSEVKIDDQVITKAGLYTFLRLSKISGLQDSLLRVEVYDAPAYDLPAESRVICQGDTVRYAGREFTRGGHYDIPLKTKEGCDSLMHLDLTVYPTYHIIENAVITDYEGYYWHGRTYTDTTTSAGYGKYTMDIDRSWSTINDCDSTHTLRLTVVETKRYHTDDTICIGQDYIWRGDTIRYEGNYVDTIRRVETYYSAIYSLHLVTVRPTVITSARTSDVCADAEGFDITFNYSGQKPAIYSVYFDVAAKRAGFKDVINAQFDDNMTAHVSLPTFATICYETHPYYVRPDNYTMRLVLDNGVCGLSRSDSIKLQIKYPSWIIEQNWTDVVAPLSADYNGGFDFANTEWYINGVLMPTNGQGYLYNTSLQPGDQVHMVATRRGENYSIPSCPITIEMPTPDVYVTPVIVYPTQAPRHAPVVTIEAPQDGEFDIFSTTGMHISGGKISEGKTQVTLPAVRGIYFIRTTQGKEKPQVHKVILY